MRIAVAGKGGVGKTTISATMARLFARRGYPTNALDDDPNPNLAAALGLPQSSIDKLRRVQREEILEEVEDDEGHTHLHMIVPFDDVFSNYGVVGPDGVQVLAMTGLLGAGKG
jgi:CO dehydrogenase maturation factor